MQWFRWCNLWSPGLVAEVQVTAADQENVWTSKPSSAVAVDGNGGLKLVRNGHHRRHQPASSPWQTLLVSWNPLPVNCLARSFWDKTYQDDFDDSRWLIMLRIWLNDNVGEYIIVDDGEQNPSPLLNIWTFPLLNIWTGLVFVFPAIVNWQTEEESDRHFFHSLQFSRKGSDSHLP